MLVNMDGSTITSFSADVDGFDVTAGLIACFRAGLLTDGTLGLRCAGLNGGLLGPGPHTLTTTTGLASGATLTRSVTWTVDAADVPAPRVRLSPPSGTYLATQAFDLDIIVTTGGLNVGGGSLTFDGQDAAAAVLACGQVEPLPSGAVSVRCPGLVGSLFGPEPHTLSIRLDFDNGASASDSVTWQFRPTSEP
jgi:hypothetical protein